MGVFTDIGHPVVFQILSVWHFPAFGRSLAVISDGFGFSVFEHPEPLSGRLWIQCKRCIIYWTLSNISLKVFYFLDTFKNRCYIMHKTDQAKETSMYLREQYLRQIRPFYRNEQIKMLTGVRRAGKTELLKMIQCELLSETDRKHIVYLSFELLENRKYRDGVTLYEYLQTRIVDEAMSYIFLDEIQFVKDWPEVVNSLKTKYRNVSIFITGSNSDLLADDKERVLGGRTLSFRVMPFSFAEYCDYRTQLNNNVPRNVEDEFASYMRWGGFPLIFTEDDDDRRQVMLESIFDSIVLRDIVRKLKLKNSWQLERVLDYVIASTGNYISGRSIAEKFDADQSDSATLSKVLEYLRGIERSCIVDIVPRFDIIGLKVLEFNNKSQ